ncbi:hypothetical protein CCR97_24500 [Rhodoplanes elegans]|uniref:DUF5615 domain-containing protein n=1 Tax=Rhodoplanes elegans TaxID=29408 RepID=A0A327KKM0_9BRAD|nr:DUF5615 family PIN-like protein [Rhodoplanes elegans]MBK5961340.1 hypothetical protein [Rhodoplanes elegans]RAI38005.1 hypothetical protein CH338_14150 [Rhodoplanes elegans]
MRWLVDECVDAALVTVLREFGHDVLDVAERAPGATDAEVIALAWSESRLLLTEDKDFGDLVFRQVKTVPGLVLLRIDPSRATIKRDRLAVAVERLGDGLFGRYTVIEEGRFRSRPLRLLD